ncbi:SDR family oxidoreductase [Propylenella binzhouense]|uniref:SDR family oxidoreductase n=1 Tax=Propylenella binzhouense TaxID=2555902 RepID=A0A964T4J7_9HYPH|nr:SDR family oxidoreductase [Propylenella binzhouense]MYZ48255.1 SDR family oxidoreductase [Propylenella binzhouense]
MADARSILITGCSSGIGACCAAGMKARGWRVFATARAPADLDRLRAEGLSALFLDYADEGSIEAAMAEVLAATGGRLDALFNNGAYAQPGAIEDIGTDLLKAQFEANFFGWHALTRLAVPVMRRQGGGRIVMNSSVLGIIALGFRGAYNATKFALEGYSDTLRIEVAPAGIHVATIEPGPIATRFTATALKHARANIDVEGSVHRDYYRRRLRAMEKGGNTRGELGPEAVLKALVHACESPRPKTHYYVTQPTRLMAAARRILPRAALHRLLRRAS